MLCSSFNTHALDKCTNNNILPSRFHLCRMYKMATNACQQKCSTQLIQAITKQKKFKTEIEKDFLQLKKIKTKENSKLKTENWLK